VKSGTKRSKSGTRRDTKQCYGSEFTFKQHEVEKIMKSRTHCRCEIMRLMKEFQRKQ